MQDVVKETVDTEEALGEKPQPNEMRAKLEIANRRLPTRRRRETTVFSRIGIFTFVKVTKELERLNGHEKAKGVRNY